MYTARCVPVLCFHLVLIKKSYYIDCNRQAISRGFCGAHGGCKKCTIQDCQSQAKKKGKCKRHGGRNICSVGDCYRKPHYRGYCYRHAHRLCNVDGCTQITFSKKTRCSQHFNSPALAISIPYHQPNIQISMDSILNPEITSTTHRIINQPYKEIIT